MNMNHSVPLTYIQAVKGQTGDIRLKPDSSHIEASWRVSANLSRTFPDSESPWGQGRVTQNVPQLECPRLEKEVTQTVHSPRPGFGNGWASSFTDGRASPPASALLLFINTLYAFQNPNISDSPIVSSCFPCSQGPHRHP